MQKVSFPFSTFREFWGPNKVSLKSVYRPQVSSRSAPENCRPITRRQLSFKHVFNSFPLLQLQRELTDTSNNRISTLEDNLRNAFATSDELSMQNRKLTQEMKEQQRIHEKRNNDMVSVKTQTTSVQLIDTGIQVDLIKQLKIRDNGNVILFVSFHISFFSIGLVLNQQKQPFSGVLPRTLLKILRIHNKHLWWNLFFSDVAGLLHTLLKNKRLCRRCFL